MSGMISATPQQKRLRDYLKLLNTIIKEAAKADFEVKVLNTIVYGDEGYPFLMLRSEEKGAKYTAVVASGAHGDEAYAVDSLVHALGDLDTDLFNFYIFPVLNPWGYAHLSRKTGDGKGINRRVGVRDITELELVFKSIPAKIDIFVDVHGDVDKPGVYAYENRLPKAPSLARGHDYTEKILTPKGTKGLTFKFHLKRGDLITLVGD